MSEKTLREKVGRMCYEHSHKYSSWSLLLPEVRESWRLFADRILALLPTEGEPPSDKLLSALRDLPYDSSPTVPYIGDEAADEIARLRAETEQWARSYGDVEAENDDLRGVIKEYESDPDYARSRFREIDLLKDQRAHDRLKIQRLRKRVEEMEGLVETLQRMHHQVENGDLRYRLLRTTERALTDQEGDDAS